MPQTADAAETGVVLEAAGETIRSMGARIGPAVVGLGPGWGRGSGVVIDDGRVLTNAHVVRGRQPAVTFQDGRRADARLAGTDPDLDVALLEVDTAGVPPVPWAATAPAVELGAPVLALGDPGGRGLRVTLGFVSAVGRSFRGLRGRRVEVGIEHTAPLPRGSSGGPLVDRAGQLVGLNTLRLEGGLILAVATGEALRRRLDLIADGQAVAPRRLGVAIAPARVARRMRRAVGLPERPGLLVRQVERASPADEAGLEPGDLIVAAGGRALEHAETLYESLDASPAGDRLTLRVVRGTEEREVAVSFDAGPEESP